MENRNLKIGILGLGLIGGSILKALAALNKYETVVVSKSSYEDAKEFASLATNDASALSDCDVVFVCSKMKQAKQNLEVLQDIVREDAIVTDVCSIKGFLVGDYKYNYISSHPMAGTEKSGFKASFPELFIGAKWILTKENEVLENLIKEMGAKPIIMKEKEHDYNAAQISHLPLLTSIALFSAAGEDAKKIASSGFRDTTRLSMTNKDLAFDMLNLNRENVVKAYEKFKSEFERIISLNEYDFKKFVEEVAEKRAKMYDKNGKNTL